MQPKDFGEITNEAHPGALSVVPDGHFGLEVLRTNKWSAHPRHLALY